MMPDFPKIYRKPARKGVTLLRLWTEHTDETQSSNKKYNMSTQFSDLYRA